MYIYFFKFIKTSFFKMPISLYLYLYCFLYLLDLLKLQTVSYAFQIARAFTFVSVETRTCSFFTTNTELVLELWRSPTWVTLCELGNAYTTHGAECAEQKKKKERKKSGKATTRAWKGKKRKADRGAHEKRTQSATSKDSGAQTNVVFRRDTSSTGR